MIEKTKGSVGILTFHWAPNYGAVLQSWALQEYLNQRGFDAEIINYVPSNHKPSLKHCFMTRHIKTVTHRIKEYRRERKIKTFRRARLKCSSITYKSNKELVSAPPLYDYYIAGSDQIWNPYFTMRGQGGITLSYFLDFVPKSKRCIAFSSSFGCKSLSNQVEQTIFPVLKRFYSISTREKEGVEILRKMGLNAVQTADPTFLLDTARYDELIKETNRFNNDIFVYILHGQKNYASNLINRVMQTTKKTICEKDITLLPEWLEHIRDSHYVLTNSFHCVVFCLLFHTKFYVFDVRGKDMGSRLSTLLGCLGLEDRLIDLSESNSLSDKQINAPIRWEAVDEKIETIRSTAKTYLYNALENKHRIDDVPSSQCSACGLCSIVCPQQCISLAEDDMGFMFPSIDGDKCTSCGVCLQRCPAGVIDKKTDDETNVLGVYSCWNLNERIRARSSSGGAFSAIAESVVEKGGIVYGAESTDYLMVKHRAVDRVEDIYRICGSKYQPSFAWDVYKDIRKEIQRGRMVLFSGTPCQVSALKEYVGDPENICYVDIACHGIPSLRVLREKCKKFEPHIVNRIEYRDKRTGWKNYTCVYYDKAGKEISHETVSESDFMRGYIENLYIRESCEGCKYANLPRVGDISLADCWSKSHDDSEQSDKGVSAVLVNSEKGRVFFDNCCNKLFVEETNLEYVLKGTPTLIKGSKRNKRKEIFWFRFAKYGYKKTMSYFFKIPIIKCKIRRLIKR